MNNIAHSAAFAAALAVGLHMQIPVGVTTVKPMPKPGWMPSVAAEETASAGEHSYVAVMREVAWRAKPGETLPDAFYDESVLSLRNPGHCRADAAVPIRAGVRRRRGQPLDRASGCGPDLRATAPASLPMLILSWP